MIKELFLYTKKDCPLCIEMQEELLTLLPSKSVEYHVIDIGDDPELRHRYGARIPVLACGNQEICEVKLDILALQSFLATIECET